MTPTELAAIVDAADRPTPDAALVAAFEASVGARLPDDYRAFLTMISGGPVRDAVVFSLAGEEVGSERLGRVAGLCVEEGYSLEERHRTAADLGIPQGLLSIMTDAGGNDIAICLRPERFGEVYFLDHEVAEYDGSPSLEDAESDGWGYAIRFASSFTAMVAGFRVARA